MASRRSTDPQERQSVLHHFAAIPERALRDKRFKILHLRVLGAVCRAVDAETGFALISQERIAYWANTPRQKISEHTADLEDWGYLEKVKRGRRKSGKFRALQYRVLYDPPDFDHYTHACDSGRVTPGGDSPESPPGVSDSDHSESNIQKESDAAEEKPRGHVSAYRAAMGAAMTTEPNTALPSHGGTTDTSAKPSFGSARRRFQRDRRAVAREKANHWDNNLRKQAEQRICETIFKSFRGEAISAALEALEPNDYEYALELELGQRWAGVNFLRRKLGNSL